MSRTKEAYQDYLTMNDFEYAIHYAETIKEWHLYEQLEDEEDDNNS